MIVHAYHGWACDASIWDRVDESLGKGFSLRRYDRGYFGNDDPFVLKEQPDAIVTHSMGLMFVPPQILANIRLLVVLNGFGFFPSIDSISRRKTLSVLNVMKSNLHVDAQAQLDVFCTAAGLSLTHRDHNKINVNLLCTDLDMLAYSAIKSDQINDGARVHFLHSTNDPIVSNAAIRDTINTFPNAFHYQIESNTHNLPNSDANLVRKLIFDK